MNALFIGRFQPFHLGHLKIINYFKSNYDIIYIGVGSSQYEHTFENPFSFEERETMITKALDAEGIKNYSIIAIPDIHNPPKWVSHVESITTDFEDVLTNNNITSNLFIEKGYHIQKTPMFDRTELSGKKIRKKILDDEPWNHLVPKEVYSYLTSIQVSKRLKSLQK